MKKSKKIHVEDKEYIYKFIDYVRLKKSKNTDVELEYYIRVLASHIGVNPEQKNSSLANKFATLLESGKLA